VSRRALTAALGLALVFALQPAAVARAGLDDTPNPGCPIVKGVPSNLGQVLEFTGSLSCFRPGGSSGAQFGQNVAPGNTQQRLAAPSLGDPCRNTFTYNVRFTNDTAGNAQARFAFAGGAAAGSFPLSDANAAMMGTHDAYITDVQLGTYEPSVATDPNSPLTCQINPTFHYFCPATGALDEFCYTWVLHPILPGSSPPQAWGPFFAQRFGSVGGAAGTIGSAPETKGVVNTPVCFWIDGMGIPVEQDLQLTLPGAPDASGRQVFYTFLARIRFQGVDWNFDDPAGNAQVPPPSACLGRPQVVAHTYPQISDGRNGDNTYHVTAVERYSITVDAFWVDSDGAHGPIGVPPGVDTPNLFPTERSQFVGQVEGIPIGSP
jgi:hypothetical protein